MRTRHVVASESLKILHNKFSYAHLHIKQRGNPEMLIRGERNTNNMKAYHWVYRPLMVFACFGTFFGPAGYGGEVSEEAAAWVNQTLGKMTLEEKVGQLIEAPCSGYDFSTTSSRFLEIKKAIKDYKVGGINIYRGTLAEVPVLINRMQDMAAIPLLITSPIENGVGYLLKGATVFPPLMALGATGSEKLAYEAGKVVGEEARVLGYHALFAPVMDVNNNPANPIINVRSFGEDPELVARLGAAYIRGIQDAGILATAKHFPGHGDTDIDSHTSLPTIRTSAARINQVELPPFKRAIDAGVGAIMTAHIVVPPLSGDANTPATLSEPILTDLLRNSLGFQGLIVTDAMNMGAITRHYQPGEAALRALRAGADIILVPPDLDATIKHIAQAVRSETVSKTPGACSLSERLNESVRRILTVKARLRLHKNRFVDVGRAQQFIASSPSAALAAEIARQSITLVKNQGALLPLPKSLQPQDVMYLSIFGDPHEGNPDIERLLRERLPGLACDLLDLESTEKRYTSIRDEASRHRIIIVGLFVKVRVKKGTVELPESQLNLVREIKKRGCSVIAIAFGNPYLLRHIPEIDAYLCAYSDIGVSQDAAIRALFGEITPQAKLPITIPDCAPRGTGLHYE
jgi:beta-N-acetylhexosaminidase